MAETSRLAEALRDRYRIERELGAGGMATVYLAEDLRHHRKVALKVLKPEIAATLGAGRFAREVEVAARLQHPNILPLHDSGEAAGFFFYVMPFVEGESLRDRLARGGELPIHDAVRILMEVADALSHAHAHGVVHRDIKPDNVMLVGRHAVVTDFGVAKAVTEATGRQILTSAGVALGTPTYMAPEQATADPHQDHRVDLYALGVLGYELLTARAPFSATTAQEMLAAHVTAEPDPVEKYRPTVSPALAAVVMKCLAKKPADRWQTADEVLARLEPLATPSGGITPTKTQPTTAIGRLPRWAQWLAAVAALAAVVLVAVRILRPRLLTITVSNMTQVTSAEGVAFQPAISPDGKEVAYAGGPFAAPHLFIRSTANVAGSGEIRLGDTSLTSQQLPAWSPDGEFVQFEGCRGARCAYSEASRLGGAVRPAELPQRALARCGCSNPPAWAPDGTRVAFYVADTIFVLSTADSTPRRVTVHGSKGWWLHSLAWSPDGKRIAYVNGNPDWRFGGNPDPSEIWVVDAEGGTPRAVATGSQHLNVSPVWLDARHLLFVSNRDGPRGVYVVEVGAQGRRGEPRAVPGIADPHSISYSAAAKKLAYAKFTVRANVWAYPLGRSSPVSIKDGLPLTSGSQVVEGSDVSPDGRWLTYDSNRRGRLDLFKMPLGGGEAVPLTSPPGDEFLPRYSPDGKEIAFAYGHTGSGTQIMVMPADGGPASAVTHHPARGLHYIDNVPSWSPDGLSIVFTSNRAGLWRPWLVSRDSVGGPWHEPVQLTEVMTTLSPVWAPDGHGILFVDPRRRDLVFVSPQGHELWRRNLVPTSGLSDYDQICCQYSRDGRTIYVMGTHRDGRSGLWAFPAAGGAPRLVIARDDPALAAAPAFFSVGSDRLYLSVWQYDSDIWVADLRW